MPPIFNLLLYIVTLTQEPSMVETMAGSSGYVKPARFQKDVHTAFLYMVGAAWTKGTSMPKSVSEWPMKRYPSGDRHL